MQISRPSSFDGGWIPREHSIGASEIAAALAFVETLGDRSSRLVVHDPDLPRACGPGVAPRHPPVTDAHRYVSTVFAPDATLDLPRTAGLTEMGRAMEGYVPAEAAQGRRSPP